MGLGLRRVVRDEVRVRVRVRVRVKVRVRVRVKVRVRVRVRVRVMVRARARVRVGVRVRLQLGGCGEDTLFRGEGRALRLQLLHPPRLHLATPTVRVRLRARVGVRG